MTTDNLTLKDFVEDESLFEKKKKKGRKKKKRKADGIRKGSGGLDSGWYTSGMPGGSSGADGGGGMGESLILELLAGITPASFSANVNSATAYSKGARGDNDKDPGMTTYPSENPEAWEEEPEQKVNKVDQARRVFQAQYNLPNATRAEIINSFMQDIGVTNSTAVSYYTRFLDEFGLSGKEGDDSLGQGSGMGGDMGDVAAPGSSEGTPDQVPEDEPEMQEFDDPNRAGIIRIVDNAHMVYKKQTENGQFEELWIYNLHDSTNDELKIRRAILAGTDIPPKKTKSADGAQTYNVTTMGNAQMLKINGLPN